MKLKLPVGDELMTCRVFPAVVYRSNREQLRCGYGDRPLLETFAFNVLVIAIAVVIHYEALYQLTRLMPRLGIPHRFRIVLGVFTALAAHAAEVWVFALSYYWMHNSEGWGELQGALEGNFLDFVYFSFTIYTTLGIGDIEPVGDLRYLTGLESLTGLVLITWSASFLYLEMTRYWVRE